MGAGISGGGPPWAHEEGGRAQGGRGHPPPSWPGGNSPCGDFCTINPQISRKIILNWHVILRTFIFGIFLYCTGKSGNRQKNTIFTLFQLNNRKQKEGREGCAFQFHPSHAHQKESINKVDQVLLTNSFRITEKFRITLCYLNGDMHIPNNKNIIFLLDSNENGNILRI